MTLAAAVLGGATMASATGVVTLRASTHVMRVGSAVTLTGRTPSADATITLVSQRLRDGSWKAAGIATVTAAAASSATTPISLRVTVRPKQGFWRYRLRSESASSTAQSAFVEVHSVGKKYVALTFDGGPWPKWTSAILKILKARDIHATFFMSGYALKPRPKLGRSVVAGGHEVGNHTFSHPNLTRVSSARVASEISKVQRLCRRLLGVTPTYFRPPYGATNKRVASVVRKLHMREVLWDADSADWLLKSPGAVVSRVMRRVRPHAVILMHDGGGDRSMTIRSLPALVTKLRAKGYDFVTMTERRQLGGEKSPQVGAESPRGVLR